MGVVQQAPGEADEVCVYLGLMWKGKFLGFVVGSLAEADTDAVGDELLDVGLRAIEVGLNDDANRAARLRGGMKPAHDVERDLGQARVLHVDAEKAAGGVGVLGEAGGDRLGKPRRQLQAHLRELDADVRIQLALGDEVEQLVVDLGGEVGFGFGGDALAERVEGYRHALPVDGFGHAERIFDGCAGDEAGAEPRADARALGEAAQRTVAGERDECGTQDRHQRTLPGERTGMRAARSLQFRIDRAVAESQSATSGAAPRYRSIAGKALSI